MADASQQTDSVLGNLMPSEVKNLSSSKGHSPHLTPPQDVPSDNENSEGPVREKLKKTSIASIPRQSDAYTDLAIEVDPHKLDQRAHPQSESSSISGVIENNVEARGRLLRKRSLEDSSPYREMQTDTNTASEGRQRKRSKDVHAGRAQADTQEHGARSPVPEEDEETTDMCDVGIPDNSTRDESNGPARQPSAKESVDQKMHDHLFSPRKKRSRDPLDGDMHREQKIMATEEARAHRRSEEYERSEGLLDVHDGNQSNGTSKDEADTENVERLSIKENEGKAFVHTSTSSPSTSITRPKSPAESPTNRTDNSSDRSAPVFHSNFKSSGFAALSKSATSPFGLVEAGSSGFSQNIGSTKLGQDGRDNKSSLDASSFSNISHTGGFGSSDSPNAAVMAPSPFGSVGFGSTNVSLGGKSFGTNFGSGNFNGPKLTSFAAVGASSRWGSTDNVKPFGAPAVHQGEDIESESNGEGDGDGDEMNEGEFNADESTNTFRQQEVDTGEEGEISTFTAARANLFAFEEGTWKERGRGVFKLNVTTATPEDPERFQKKGRFIMRAHQTYRILLNTPVFKQMQVGDSKGKEPPGKQLSLAVIEGGKPTPYLVRLSDSSEAKTLYHEIRNLQEVL